jgi:hypothetical protein
MPNVFVTTRWALAVFAAVCVYMIALALPVIGFAVTHEGQQGSAVSFGYGFTNVLAVTVATFLAIWAGSAIAPRENRPFATLMFGAAASLYIIANFGHDLMTHSLSVLNAGDVGGTLVGFYWVWRFLWKPRYHTAKAH